jgi:hypothetical protein
MALCSEVRRQQVYIGTVATRFEHEFTATTSVSLLARAIFLRALMAWMVGTSPAKPTHHEASSIVYRFGLLHPGRVPASPAYTLISGRSAQQTGELS